MSAEPSPAASALQARVPDFFIVGHAKSGTTALYEMLRRHPQIYMPDVKELWFFSPELRSRFRKPSARRPETLDGYLALFAAAGREQRAGEASPRYLQSRTAASRIAEVQPAARIIAILREPASFLRSLHLQCVQNQYETEIDLGKALALEEARRRGEHIPRYCGRPHELLYSDNVRYVEQLRRFYAVFAPEQVLVLIYDDFRRDNEATVRAVLRFLEVDDTVPVETIEANPSVRVRSQRLHRLVHQVEVGRNPVSRAVKTGIKALTTRQLRRQALRGTRRRVVFADTRPPDESVMLEMRRRFKPEVVALSEYLGRDLVTLWGYDRVG